MIPKGNRDCARLRRIPEINSAKDRLVSDFILKLYNVTITFTSGLISRAAYLLKKKKSKQRSRKYARNNISLFTIFTNHLTLVIFSLFLYSTSAAAIIRYCGSPWVPSHPGDSLFQVARVGATDERSSIIGSYHSIGYRTKRV